MKNLIKVENIKKNSLHGFIYEVEGKLIVLECPKGEARLINEYKLVKGEPDDDFNVDDLHDYYKPILISETEKIENGDKVYNSHKKLIEVAGLDIAMDLCNPKHGFHKILALPEHFSNKQLQDIVDDDMNDGYDVRVECVKVYQNSKMKEPSLALLPSEWDVTVKIWDVIKLDNSNHVSFKKFKIEKIYTADEMYGFVGEWISHTQRPTGDNFKKWFEQRSK